MFVSGPGVQPENMAERNPFAVITGAVPVEPELADCFEQDRGPVVALFTTEIEIAQRQAVDVAAVESITGEQAMFGWAVRI